MTLYTVGHSTLPIDAFIDILRRNEIRHVADVRRFPASRRHPQFNAAALASSLNEAGIGYSHHPELGGRRTPQPDSPNSGLRNAAFRGYADYMQTVEFSSALDRLLALARERSTAMMCAEAVHWRCHRSLIADAVLTHGESVVHLTRTGTAEHVLHQRARPHRGVPVYPPEEGADQSELFD